MKTKFTIFRPDGTFEDREVDLKKDPGLDALGTILLPLMNDGRDVPIHFEHVSVLHANKSKDMFVDEDGHSKRLPVNEKATDIYHENWKVNRPEAFEYARKTNQLIPIVGVAVLFHRRVWF